MKARTLHTFENGLKNKILARTPPNAWNGPTWEMKRGHLSRLAQT